MYRSLFARQISNYQIELVRTKVLALEKIQAGQGAAIARLMKARDEDAAHVKALEAKLSSATKDLEMLRADYSKFKPSIKEEVYANHCLMLKMLNSTNENIKMMREEGDEANENARKETMRLVNETMAEINMKSMDAVRTLNDKLDEALTSIDVRTRAAYKLSACARP